MSVIILVLALVGMLVCFAAAIPAVDGRIGHAGAGLLGVALLLSIIGIGG